MINKVLQNCSKPEGVLGKACVKMMNWVAAPAFKWSCQYIMPRKDAAILDVGCGGGKNISNFLKRCPKCIVTGIDYSAVSVDQAIKQNNKDIKMGNCKIVQGSAEQMPFADETFTIVTAFDTIYFWQEMDEAFKEVFRVLKIGGEFLICNKLDKENSSGKKWVKMVKGMQLYDKIELKEKLTVAGFVNIQTYYESTKGWLCITANK